jgi:D-amino-acid dehydrogenase
LGNCRQFSHLLKDLLIEAGAEFHFSTPVIAIHSGPGVHLVTQDGATHCFDQIILCTGTGSAELQGAGCKKLPLARLWSHSVSAQIREPLNAPHSAVVDHHQRISISRMGSRIRVSGGAELGGVAGGSTAKTTRLLFHTLQSHFPGAADFSRSMQLWKGCSIFSPDALPLVGPSAKPGVWLNLGHGHNGWGMACGAARILADQIGGRPADIDATKLDPGRFNS